MQLYCCDGRQVQNWHLEPFRKAFSGDVDTNSQSSSAATSTAVVTLNQQTLLKDCKLLSRVTKFCQVENSNNNNNEFVDLLTKNENQISKTTSILLTATKTLDFRGLHSASLKTLSAFAIWIEQNISSCYKEYEKLQKQESRNSRLKRDQDAQAQQEHDQLQQQFGANDDRVARLQENHRWEPVLASRVPERVAFDLVSLFPTDAHKKTRIFCKEVLLSPDFSWEDVTQLHLFANFVGCESLSATVASLIALHLRQQTNPYLVGNSEYSIVASTSQKNENILIEDLQKEKRDKIKNSIPAAEKKPTVAVSNNSSTSTAPPIDKKMLHETVLWLRKQLGTE
jgi:hypothetical protein